MAQKFNLELKPKVTVYLSFNSVRSFVFFSAVSTDLSLSSFSSDKLRRKARVNREENYTVLSGFYYICINYLLVNSFISRDF